jgi:hypothetical protein
MRGFLMICASFLIIANGSTDENSPTIAVEKYGRVSNQILDQMNTYLATVESFDLENSPYSNDTALFEEYTDDRPLVNKEVKVFSGEKMISQRSGMVVPCITPKETWTVTKWGYIYELKKNRKVCQTIVSNKHYIADYPLVTNYDIELYVVAKEKRGKFRFGVGGPMPTSWVKKNAIEGQDFEYSKAFKSVPDSLQRSIEYSGRKGTVLTFIYSEFKDGIARSAFTREFTVDLSEGNMGGFKGAIFQVMEATNFEIAYKIKRHFP